MADLFSIPTLMVCTASVAFIVAFFLTTVWLGDRSHRALSFWAAALWVGAVGSLLLGMRTVAPFWLAIGLGNMLGAAAYAMLWLGSRSFGGKQPDLLLAAAGPLAWVAVMVFGPAIRNDVNLRIVAMSIIVAAYAGAFAFEMLRGHRQEPLPSRRLAAIFFGSHAVFYFIRAPLSILDPVANVNGSGHGAWYALISFELFLHTILTAVVLFALIKERGEHRYRLASERDPLTGLANRRFFVESVGRLLGSARAASDHRNGVMLVLDIDHFKVINDTHGHLAGDRVLVAFSAAIAALTDRSMVLGRFGGEEFALFAPGLDLSGGKRLAEQMRLAVSAGALSTREGDAVPVTVSIGLVSAADVPLDLDALLAAADLALYEAKRAGRNRVAAYDPAGQLNAMARRGAAERTTAEATTKPVVSAAAARR